MTFISQKGSQTVQGKPLPNLAEITATSPTGEKIGLMIIDPSIFPGKYTAEDLLHIKKRQLPLYDIWKCVCHESNYKEVCEIVEPSFCLKMGPDFEKFMNSLKS